MCVRCIYEDTLPEDVTMICLDMRSFQDPQRDRNKVNHVGTHWRVIDGIVHNRLFQETLHMAITRIREVLAQKGKVCMITYCNRGRHRSVAWAIILDHVLMHMQDLPTPALLMHSARDTWSFGACGECSVCKRPSERRDQALEQALQMARQMV